MASAVIGTVQPYQANTDDFKEWAEVFLEFLAANGLDPSSEKDESRCRAIYCSSLGLPTYVLLKNLISPKKPADKKLAELIQILQDHYKPAPKALSERFKFERRQ
jgi:hypothetical protein